MIWYILPDHDVKSGKTLVYKQCSLRSIGKVDVEVIARALGGGGHKNAAGYRQLVNENN
jgi:nanoRNase/pAp phosphatase (c-di-AMP/oligoRNAs hydrolase)